MWFTLLQKAEAFGEALRAHVAVMDRHDPERRVKLYVDEWGVWYAQPSRAQPSGNAPGAEAGGCGRASAADTGALLRLHVRAA